MNKLNKTDSASRLKQFGYIGALAAMLFVLNMVVGATISYATGVPFITGFATGFTVPFFFAITYLQTKRIGSVTLLWTLYSILAIPTVLMGPPGVYKVVIGILAGAAYDLGVFVFRRGTFSLFAGITLYTAALIALFLLAYNFLDLPGKEQITTLAWLVGSIFWIEGIISTALGVWFYRYRLKPRP